MRGVTWLKPLPWIVLFLLFLGGAALWLLFVQEQRLHLGVGFRAQMERLGDEMLRGRLEGRLSDDSLPEPVRTFAIYDQRGERVANWGQEAPLILELPPDRRGFEVRMTRQPDGGTELVKVLRPLRPRMNLWSDGDGDENWSPPGPQPRGGRPQGFFLLRVQDTSLEARMWGWTAAGILGTLAWGGFMAFVAYLWFRTRRYQEAFSQHRELLQFAEASRTLSHELQTPLAAILLQTALLKRNSDGPPPSEVTIIAEEAQRMSALVTRVRDFLKDPRGLAELINLADLEATLRGRFEPEVPWQKLSGAEYFVKFDPHRLRSVLENLIKNALESGPNPQPLVKLSKPRPGWIRLEVLDSGTGFSAESLNRVGAPFFTTKTTGTGIGISIAQSFVKAAGGRFKFENRPEGGARVWLDLPEAVKERHEDPGR